MLGACEGAVAGCGCDGLLVQLLASHVAGHHRREPGAALATAVRAPTSLAPLSYSDAKKYSESFTIKISGGRSLTGPFVTPAEISIDTMVP
jgi:hypothetical protein